MPTEFSLPSFAKINLLLNILGKRDDGFHELFTVFQTVSLHDTITFTEDEQLGLTCTDRAVPTDGRNLIIKASRALQKATGSAAGARIHLDKRIPSPGGLGGGSSNAAVALMGLTRLWDIDPETVDLQALAAGLGSDVPFFLHGGAACGRGRGEQIEPADDVGEDIMLIVTPNVSVSTRDAFARIDAPTLTIEARKRILRVCRLQAGSLDLHHSALINDFEASVFSAFPEVRRVKETLLELGAVNAAMCGSGASVFAVFDKKETRHAAIKALDHESTWRKFAVSTVARSEYRDLLHI